MNSKEIILIKTTDEIEIPDTELDLNQKLELRDINLFPNPNNGAFTLRFISERKVPTTISVIDVTGKEVYRETLNDFNGQYDKRIDLQNPVKGTYFVNIIQEDKILTEQFILSEK